MLERKKLKSRSPVVSESRSPGVTESRSFLVRYRRTYVLKKCARNWHLPSPLIINNLSCLLVVLCLKKFAALHSTHPFSDDCLQSNPYCSNSYKTYIVITDIIIYYYNLGWNTVAIYNNNVSQEKIH